MEACLLVDSVRQRLPLTTKPLVPAYIDPEQKWDRTTFRTTATVVRGTFRVSPASIAAPTMFGRQRRRQTAEIAALTPASIKRSRLFLLRACQRQIVPMPQEIIRTFQDTSVLKPENPFNLSQPKEST